MFNKQFNLRHILNRIDNILFQCNETIENYGNIEIYLTNISIYDTFWIELIIIMCNEV